MILINLKRKVNNYSVFMFPMILHFLILLAMAKNLSPKTYAYVSCYTTESRNLIYSPKMALFLPKDTTYLTKISTFLGKYTLDLLLFFGASVTF